MENKQCKARKREGKEKRSKNRKYENKNRNI